MRAAELAANFTIQEIAAVNVNVQQSALQVLDVGRESAIRKSEKVPFGRGNRMVPATPGAAGP